MLRKAVNHERPPRERLSNQLNGSYNSQRTRGSKAARGCGQKTRSRRQQYNAE